MRSAMQFSSLADGGMRKDTEIKEAHALVAQRAPVEMAQLRELYLRSQYLMLPDAGELSRQCIEDDLLAAKESLETEDDCADGQFAPLLGERVRRVEQYMNAQCETRAMRYYARGLTLGALLSGLVGATISIVATLIFSSVAPGKPLPLDLYEVLVAIAGGAAGAAVSVLIRTT